MKKTLVASLIMMFSITSFSQAITTEVPAVKTDYLQKSKKQKTAAWVLMGGGTALFLTGFAIPEGEYISSGNFWDDLFWGGHHKNDEIKSTFWGIGTLSMLGSIPFFLASGKNKRKAENISASFKMESRTFIQQNAITRTHYPAFSIKLPL